MEQDYLEYNREMDQFDPTPKLYPVLGFFHSRRRGEVVRLSDNSDSLLTNLIQKELVLVAKSTAWKGIVF